MAVNNRDFVYQPPPLDDWAAAEMEGEQATWFIRKCMGGPGRSRVAQQPVPAHWKSREVLSEGWSRLDLTSAPGRQERQTGPLVWVWGHEVQEPGSPLETR
jgi:hypothetical protein